MFQVVLLGDHKQLRPVVSNDFCKSLGMERSLFERYQNEAWMLDVQYRMVRPFLRWLVSSLAREMLLSGLASSHWETDLLHEGSSLLEQ